MAERLAKALVDADTSIAGTKAEWDQRRKGIEERYEKLLRELQKSNVDGAEFIRLRKQIEELRPLLECKEALKRDLASNEDYRRKLVSEWEDIKSFESREFQRAAANVSGKLRGRVQVAGNREPLEQLLREAGGDLSAGLERLRSLEQMSLPDLAQRCREGKDALMKEPYRLPAGSAARIAQSGPDLFLRIEELDLPATTKVELNTAPDGEPEAWRSLEALSTGQKATAVLLLLESDAPLVGTSRRTTSITASSRMTWCRSWATPN